MKLKINTEIDICEDKKKICERFGTTAKDAMETVEYLMQFETLTSYSDIVIELLNIGRTDIVLSLATAFISSNSKSTIRGSLLNTSRFRVCPECNGTGQDYHFQQNYKCQTCKGNGLQN